MQKNCFFSVLCIFTGIFFLSCGLDEIISVSEPSVTYNNPLFSNSDPLTWYFSFKTSSDSGNYFIGTEVYYKIYNSSSTLTSERSSILSVNTSTNSSAAATRMIETYSYQSLGTNISTENSVYFPEKGSSVIFRLKTSKSADASTAYSADRYRYHACVIGPSYNTHYYIPYRNGNRSSFDFFDADEDDKNKVRDVLPVYGDGDYKCAESDKGKTFDEYYVQMFAVGISINPETVSPSYSLVLDLGSVPIKKGE